MLLAGDGQREALGAFTQQLITSIGAPIERQGQSYRVGASVGIARFPNDGDDLSRLVRCADLALYDAKKQGRGDFAFFEDLPPRTTLFATL